MMAPRLKKTKPRSHSMISIAATTKSKSSNPIFQKPHLPITWQSLFKLCDWEYTATNLCLNLEISLLNKFKHNKLALSGVSPVPLGKSAFTFIKNLCEFCVYSEVIDPISFPFTVFLGYLADLFIFHRFIFSRINSGNIAILF